MTKDHAYLARTKDQEKEVIAVPDGAGGALCVSFDKHWTYSRPWDELHIIAPLVEEAAEARTTPAVTRDDLPDFGAMASVMARWKVSYGAVSDVLDAVVAHLNANGGLPADDRWRRAHSIVEQERDTARESLRESYGLARSLNMEAHQATKRAEAAEARTTRTVSREDVDEAVKGTLDGWNITLPDNLFDAQIDAVCALFGVEAEPADPVEAKARELWEVARAEGSPEWGKTSEWVEKGFTALAAHVLGQEDSVPDLLSAVRSVLNYLDECDEDSWTPRSSDIRNLLSIETEQDRHADQ